MHGITASKVGQDDSADQRASPATNSRRENKKKLMKKKRNLQVNAGRQIPTNRRRDPGIWEIRAIDSRKLGYRSERKKQK